VPKFLFIDGPVSDPVFSASVERFAINALGKYMGQVQWFEGGALSGHAPAQRYFLSGDASGSGEVTHAEYGLHAFDPESGSYTYVFESTQVVFTGCNSVGVEYKVLSGRKEVAVSTAGYTAFPPPPPPGEDWPPLSSSISGVIKLPGTIGGSADGGPQIGWTGETTAIGISGVGSSGGSLLVTLSREFGYSDLATYALLSGENAAGIVATRSVSVTGAPSAGTIIAAGGNQTQWIDWIDLGGGRFDPIHGGSVPALERAAWRVSSEDPCVVRVTISLRANGGATYDPNSEGVDSFGSVISTETIDVECSHPGPDGGYVSSEQMLIAATPGASWVLDAMVPVG
jgi:hypothetical protein